MSMAMARRFSLGEFGESKQGGVQGTLPLHLAFWHVLELGLDRDPFDFSYVIKPLEYQ